MIHIRIRFYEELNDFLPQHQRKQTIEKTIPVPGSVKDLIESFGVPHTEVDLVLVNSESVRFDYRVRDGDRISVYPVFESLDISPVMKLRPEPLRKIRFVLDVHLGKLARYLRLLGFDTIYRNDIDDPELADISRTEHRILLTRDRNLLKRKVVSHGYFVRNIHAEQQVREVVQRFDLAGKTKPFTRCVRCNGLLQGVEKSAVLKVLPPRTAAAFETFNQCMSCGKVYWKGSHYSRLVRICSEALEEFD